MNRLEDIYKKYGLQDASSVSFAAVKQIANPLVGFNRSGTNHFIDSEWNFADIDRAASVDGYLARSIQKKVQKFMLSGWEFVGNNPQTVEYVQKRIKQLEVASNKPFSILMAQTIQDMFSKNNAMWVFKRDANRSGGRSYTYLDKEWQPIAGIFIAPFSTLRFKCKENGEIVSIKQNNTNQPKEFKAEDTLHFYTEKRPGYITGTPTLFTALEDIALLRKLEEELEELVHACLFPLYHYQIGNEKFPMKVNPQNGKTEAEMLADTLSYMPPSGVYISDWRHKIEALGAEGKALQIEYFLNHMKARVFADLAMSSTDFGEADTSNKGTASVQSKMLTESVESMQIIMAEFINHYLIRPLLLESDFKFDVLDRENIVNIQFGKTDTAEQTLKENNATQLYAQNAITHEELRQRIGKRPLTQEQEKTLLYHKFPNRTELAKEAQVKAGAAGSTQAQNQHGKSPKKTSKDFNLFFEPDFTSLDSFLLTCFAYIEYMKFKSEQKIDFEQRLNRLEEIKLIYNDYLILNEAYSDLPQDLRKQFIEDKIIKQLIQYWSE